MHCFFRISIAGATPQTVVFELDADKCPITCKNFLEICKANSTAARPSSGAHSASNEIMDPTYRGTEIHRIVPNFMIQGGDFTSFDGKGGYAHPYTNHGQKTFADENFSVSHSSEGVLSMANRGKNTNGSQFFVTLNKCLHLDGKHVAFGRVVEGLSVVREIARVETEGDRPVRMQRVVIVDCGEGWGKEEHADDGSTSGSSESSYDRDKKKKHHKSKKKKHHKHRYDSKHHRKYSKGHKRDKDYDSSNDESRDRKKRRRKHKSKSKHRRREREGGTRDLSSSESISRERSSSDKKSKNV